MKFNATKTRVAHGRGNSDIPPDSFLAELVSCFRGLPETIFDTNQSPHDVFTSVFRALGPWEGMSGSAEWFTHRKAAMMEVMRVLGAFESAWNWMEGKDMASHSENDAETMSAGLWQISYNSRGFGDDLTRMIAVGNVRNGTEFQWKMKHDHQWCIEYAARLFRHTTHHNGPLVRHEVDGQLSREAVKEFIGLLA